MKRTYKKKSNLINKTGYTPGYDTEKNPVNYIPSEDITMANTPYPLYATPLDENGNPIGKGMIMQPGGEYKFPNAAYVAETPMFAKGGEKNDWISAKISTLVREGYPQKQAVAIAYSMYEDMKKENGGFQLPMYQTAGKYSFTNTFPGSNFPKPKFSADPNIATPEQFSEQMNKITEVNPGKYGLGKDPNYVSPLSEESLTAGKDWAAKNPLPEGVEKPMSTNVFGAEVEDSSKNSTVKSPDIKTQEPFQFFNPYGGVDIPTAGVMFGQSLENKDTLGAIASGAKVALGTARNILGGMGQARRENYMKQQYYEKQREGMTGTGREQMMEAKFGGYYQEGGMEEPQGGDIQQQVAQALQQGMSPEEVMQQLVQMGMPEDQAVALIQGIMQQMQPSTPQLRRGGMMYYEDGGEEDDEDGGEYQDEEEYGDLINKYPNRNPNISRVEDTENKTDWYEEGMDRDTYYGFKNQLESSGYKSVPKEESKSDENKNEQKEESYDKNSARDTWVAKTGLPWSEAKRLGYTDGSAKDNMKLLSELNDPRFKKEYLRKNTIIAKENKQPNNFDQKLYDTILTQGNAYFNNKRWDYLQNKSNRTKEEEKEYQNAIGVRNDMYLMEQISNNPSKLDKSSLNRGAKVRARQKYLRDVYNKSKGNIVTPFSNNTTVPKNPFILNPQSSFTPVTNLVKQPETKANWEIYKDNISGWLNNNAPTMLQPRFYQDGGEYGEGDMVRYGGGNTGIEKKDLKSLAKKYNKTPEQFLEIISEGEVRPDGGTMLRIGGANTGVPANWREEYKKSKSSTTGFRGALNKGLDYIGVDPIFNMGGYYQDGGEQQVAQQVAQAMQQGMQPQEAMSMLMESGMTEDQALQMVQAIMEQLQQQTETPQLRKGGEMIKRADGSYSRRGLWDNIRDNRGSGKKPTKEMLEQEAKIKREYQEGGMEPSGDPMEAMMQQIAQMLNQGADPQQIIQMLVEAGVPEEQAVQMVEDVMQQSEQMPEMRDGGIPERYKKMGFSKVGAKKKSTRPGKKWMVLAKKGDQYKIVHGGDSNMKDFSQHGSEERKDRFWNRMGGRDSAKANDPFSPLYWHKRFGTWQEGGEMMDEEMEGEDETMENESAMLEQIESQVEQALKQGADPQQIMEQLIQMGIPQEVAQQMIEEILQEIEGGETEMEEPEEGTPQMSKGGKYIRALVGKTIKNYKYNPKTDSYIVSYE